MSTEGFTGLGPTPVSEHAKRNQREIEETIERLRAREAEREKGGELDQSTDAGPMR